MGKKTTTPQYSSATPTVGSQCVPILEAAIVTVTLTEPSKLLVPGFLASLIDQQLVSDVPDELAYQRSVWCNASCLILDGEGSIEWGTQSMFDADCATEVDLPATLSIGTAQKYLISAAGPVKVIAAKGPCSAGVSPAGNEAVTIDELPPIELAALFDGSLTPTEYCTDDAAENQIFICKQTDSSTGEITALTSHVFDTATSTIVPYSGGSKKCATKTFSVTSLTTKTTCNPIVACFEDGECSFFEITNPVTGEKVPVSESELNIPGENGSKVFESEILELILSQADNPITSVVGAIGAAVTAGLPDLVCKETGDSTPATMDDICAYKVRRIPCGASYLTDPTDIATAVEVGADDAYYVGGVSINSAEDSYGAVDPLRPVTAGADAVAVWCFKLQRELSKAEIAAL